MSDPVIAGILSAHLQRMAEINADGRAKANESADILTGKIRSTLHREDSKRDAVFAVAYKQATGVDPDFLKPPEGNEEPIA